MTVIPFEQPAHRADFIESFLSFSEGLPSPEIFRLWTAISIVAGAMERRCWLKALPKPTFPNLFVILVASPGIGKGIIEEAQYFWKEVPKLRVSPDSMTAASMLDSLTEADRKIIIDGQLLYEYHCLLVAAEEFGVLVPAHDLEFLSRLNSIYNNPPWIRVRRKYIKEEIQIIKPMLNILAGTQPGFLGSMVPEEAWTMGFTSRLIMVYSGTSPKVALFADHTPMERARPGLISALKAIAELHGQFTWEPAAAEAAAAWYRDGCPPVPEHTKLLSYSTRRFQYFLKLLMVSAVAERYELVIRASDVIRAKRWLLAAEQTMPDIFKDMLGKSDAQTLQDLHMFMWKDFIKDRRPIHEARIMNFLKNRVPVDKIYRLVDLAERANIIARVAGESKLYIPKPTAEHGLE